MSDPRAANCREFALNADGKVVGVELAVLPFPPGQYELAEVCLIDEMQAAGNINAYVFVNNRAGGAVLGAKVYLAWPWSGQPGDITFKEKALPGNTNYPPNHVIINGYNPFNAKGPLAIYVGTAAGEINSDVVAGLGLPFNRHVGYQLMFRERVVAPPPPPPPPLPLPEDEPAGLAIGTLADKCRWWLEESVRQDEAGNAVRAKAIRYSLIKHNGGLFYRLENELKALALTRQRWYPGEDEAKVGG